MYPKYELTLLVTQKAVVRRRIHRGRADCKAVAAEALRPLEWLDRVLAFWRRLSPYAQLAAVPIGLIIQRGARPRLKVLGSLLSWSAPVFRALRGIAFPVKIRSTLPAPSTRR